MNWETSTCMFLRRLGVQCDRGAGGMLHLHLPASFPHADMHIGHWHPHFHIGGGHGTPCTSPSSGELPFFNMATLMVFVCWFGGTAIC